MMKIPPPEQFEGFCVGFDVALYRNSPPKAEHDVNAYLDNAIDYGLDWCGPNDLRILRDFLKTVLEEPDAGEQLNKLWKDTLPRIAFFSKHRNSPNATGIVHVFAQVLAAIEKKLG